MQQITYRKASLDDCLEVATLKGIVWNTTYFSKPTTYGISVDFPLQPDIL